MPSPSSPSPTAPAATTISRPSAYQRVYEVPELRSLILGYLSRRTLLTMMSVERSLLLGAGSIVFKRTSLKSSQRWSRKTAVGRAYNASIHILDISPAPTTCGAIPEYASVISSSPPRAPLLFDIVRASHEVKEYRKQYPNVRCIEYLYPAVQGDDCYRIYIDDAGEIIEAQVISQVCVDVYAVPFTPPFFPEPPAYSGVAVRHSIELVIEARSPLCITKVEGQEHAEEWRRWLYEDMALEKQGTTGDKRVWIASATKLDKRVVAIHHPATRPRYWVPLDIDSAISFLTRRAITNCQPMRSFVVDVQHDEIPIERFSELVAAVGRDISTLDISGTAFGGLANTNAALAILSKLCPRLADITLRLKTEKKVSLSAQQPLKGLPTILRRVCIMGLDNALRSDIPPYLCQLGNLDTVFQDGGLLKVKATRDFHKKVIERKVAFNKAVKAKGKAT